MGAQYTTDEICVHGVRQDVPPRMERIDYEIMVDTDEPDRRLKLLHDNVRKYGTVFNILVPGTDLKVCSFARSDKHVNEREDAHAAISPSLFSCREGRHTRGRRLGG